MCDHTPPLAFTWTPWRLFNVSWSALDSMFSVSRCYCDGDVCLSERLAGIPVLLKHQHRFGSMWTFTQFVPCSAPTFRCSRVDINLAYLGGENSYTNSPRQVMVHHSDSFDMHSSWVLWVCIVTLLCSSLDWMIRGVVCCPVAHPEVDILCVHAKAGTLHSCCL